MIRYKTNDELVINKLLKWQGTQDERHDVLLWTVWFVLQSHCCIFHQILQRMVKFSFPPKLSPGQWGDLSYGSWQEGEGELSNPWGSGPPSVASSIPPRPCQNPPDSSPHYLPISGLAPPSDRTEMEGFTVDVRRKDREEIKRIHTWCPLNSSDICGKLENVARNERSIMMMTRGWMGALGQKLRCQSAQWENTVILTAYSLHCK